MTAKLNTQEIYAQLRRMIIDLEIPPATRMTEQQLCNYFSVSRTPIRAALQHLASDGLVEIKPKQGCFVRNIDLELIHEYYDVRVVLENMVLGAIAKLPEPTGLIELATSWDPAARNFGSEITDELKHAEEAFHLQLAGVSQNRVLERYIGDVNEQIRVVRLFGWPDAQSVTDTYEEHWRICQAILQGDLATAQSDMTAHIRKSQDNANRVTIKQLFQNHSAEFFSDYA